MTNEELDRVEHYFRSLMGVKLGDLRFETKNQITNILKKDIEKHGAIVNEAYSMVSELLKEIRRLQEENQRLKEAHESGKIQEIEEASK